MNIPVTVDNMKFLECLSSETRVRIVQYLAGRPMNIRELSQSLGLSSPIVTRHIQMMEEAGIVRSEALSGVRGVQKLCRLALDEATLQFRSVEAERPLFLSASIPVGQYSSYRVKPTCGLAGEEGLIGMMDDPRYFADPEHVKARLLWFGSGYVEYRIPNLLVSSQSLTSLECSFEICSETPGYNENWPSDIRFSVDGTEVGVWTCPGNYGGRRGVYTPAWWPERHTQYGLLKFLAISATGTYLDGVRLSDATPESLGLGHGGEPMLRISCLEDKPNCGGVTLLGSGFGNYNQDIEVRLYYS